MQKLPYLLALVTSALNGRVWQPQLHPPTLLHPPPRLAPPLRTPPAAFATVAAAMKIFWPKRLWSWPASYGTPAVESLHWMCSCASLADKRCSGISEEELKKLQHLGTPSNTGGRDVSCQVSTKQCKLGDDLSPGT